MPGDEFLLKAPPKIDSIRIPPDPRIIDALRNIGYSLESALADLVDNSIDAGAETVLIRFVRDDSTLIGVLVIDDGQGMTQPVLDQAMQFAGRKTYGEEDLGMYGMGLKTASLSQADRLSVLTRSGPRSVLGRRWTVEGAKKDWSCDILDQDYCADVLSREWADGIDLSRSGTIVRWDDVRDFDKARGEVEKYLAKAYRSVAHHFGLHFHRLISSGQVRIVIDTENADTGTSVPSEEIKAINPFGYPKSGRSGYPKKFTARIPELGSLAMEAHIWPARSKLPEYKLGGKAAASQGFYFYRNDRLIQAGGWDNVAQDAEPHLSLARVAIDIPKAFESYFDVQFNKSDVKTPRSFVDAVHAARAADGTAFDEYLALADTVYRTKPHSANAVKPMIPMGSGFRSEVAHKHGELVEAVRGRQLDVRWKPLRTDRVFDIEKDDDVLFLNSRYREALNGGARNSGADAPLVKTLLYLLLEPEFKVERVWKARKRRFEMYNAVLLAAIKASRSRA